MFRDTNRGKIVEKSWQTFELRFFALPAQAFLCVRGKPCLQRDASGPCLVCPIAPETVAMEKRFPEFLTTSRNYPGLPYRFKNRTVRAVDSTTISLTAESMCWAKHRNQKAAAKMHTALMGYNENAVRWQVWMALLAYLLLRFIAWYNNWKHHFSRLFMLLRAVLWNFFTISSVIECCDTPRVRRAHIRGSPETAYQPCFVGFE